jgi:outer membrane protein TolC
MSAFRFHAWKPSQKPSHAFRLAPVALLLFLAGCAVQPVPLADADNDARANDLLSRVTQEQEPITGPIDLYQAMARAIKYNLDYRVELMNQAVMAKDLNLRRFDMLPKVVANLDYAGRDNYSGGISRSLLTGRVSLEPSTSSDRNVTQADLTMSWDVLDFGLSYVRAQQAGDEAMVAEERKRKVINRIIEDVRSAFWLAASAERLLDKTLELESVTRTALAQAEQQAGTGLTRPLAALTYQRELLSIQRDSQSLSRELAVAKQQLAALMNLPPDAQYTIALPERTVAWQTLQVPYADMLKLAVANRPELREVAYQMRSNERETTAALLRMLPSLRVFLGADWSSNSYLYNSNWTGWGARASWNLMNVFRLPADQDKVKAQGDLLDARALALTMQVQISWTPRLKRCTRCHLQPRSRSRVVRITPLIWH